MTNLSHWAYWTQSKETWHFQALGSLWYLKVGRSKSEFLDKGCLCTRRCGEKKWTGKVRHVLLFLRASGGEGCPLFYVCLKTKKSMYQWTWVGTLSSTVTKAEAGQLFAHRSWVRMALVPLFPILFCAKCNAEKWLIAQQTQVSYCLGSGEVKCPNLNYGTMGTMSRCSD